MSPGAAHVLNNILGKIMGCADIALMSCPDGEVRLELETIIALVQDAAQVVGGRAPLAGLSASAPAERSLVLTGERDLP